MITLSEITRAARALDLVDIPLEVHSSLRSFGVVDGGADAVVDGVIDAGCTLLVPTFSTFHYAIPQPVDRPDLCFRRNATPELVGERHIEPAPVYTTDSLIMNPDMGEIPAAVLRRSGSVRGNHALNSFAALGPLADDLITLQTGADVYGPLRRLAELGGFVVLMGVDLDRMTLLHLAEQVAGRTLFQRWVRGADGEPEVVSIGSCSFGFENFAPVLQIVERTAMVGNSCWRIFPARDVIALASRAISEDPQITRCENADCARCPDAIGGGPMV